MYIFCKAIAETAGIDYVLPRPTSNRTREIGEYSTNESVCLPLKIILGNLAEALEDGADTVIMVGSGPPCRLGLYDRVLKIALADMGYQFRWLTIPGIFNWKAFLQNYEETKELKKELTLKNIVSFPLALVMGWKKMVWCEKLEKEAAVARAAAAEPDDADRLLKTGLERIDRAKSIRSLNHAGTRTLKRLAAIEKSGRPPLKVMMVGEVYTVMEPTINMDVERRLGHLGVIVERSSYFSTHIRKGSRLDRKLLHEREQLLKEAVPYLEFDVGGECNFSVAEAIQAKRMGYDGVVHVYPFSCMPENNAAAVLSVVGMNLNMPIHSVVVDRQDMGLRIDTQLEAFVDVMRWRKQGRLS
jgi:predicted nucleotide-binding protein (sugar kinase/HSP70/actin superfamily)